MPGPIVTFSYPLWVARYPEFNGVDELTAQAYFNEATLYFRNEGTGPVNDPTGTVQLTLLNMLTAHIALLNALQVNGVPNTEEPGGTPPPNIVGRISQASEGSVSVSSELSMAPSTSGMFVWLEQTRDGLAFWAAPAAFRTMRYIPGPRRNFTPSAGLG